MKQGKLLVPDDHQCNVAVSKKHMNLAKYPPDVGESDIPFIIRAGLFPLQD